MQLLKDRILSDGLVIGDIVKVGSFLNHQMDIGLLQEIGKEFKRRYADEKITKILTIESSGIGIAAIAAQYFDNAPVVFAKKTQSKNLVGEVLTSKVVSFTKGIEYDIIVEKCLLSAEDRVLVIDDFLAKGQALNGLIDLIEQSGAALAGCGIVIEKGFQDGGTLIRNRGIRVESLAIIDGVSDGKVIFK